MITFRTPNRALQHFLFNSGECWRHFNRPRHELTINSLQTSWTKLNYFHLKFIILQSVCLNKKRWTQNWLGTVNSQTVRSNLCNHYARLRRCRNNTYVLTEHMHGRHTTRACVISKYIFYNFVDICELNACSFCNKNDFRVHRVFVPVMCRVSDGHHTIYGRLEDTVFLLEALWYYYL